MLLTGLGGLFLVSWPPVEWLLALPLEFPYREVNPPREPADAIVVLAGGGDPANTELPVQIPGPGTYARCRYAAWLYHNWRPVPVVLSGGTHSRRRLPVATLMAHVLQSEGVPSHHVIEENRSTNTKQNAVLTAELLRQKNIRRIALVVDADSMLRAELCFRKEGIVVVPVPMGQRTRGIPDDLLPSAASIRGNEITLHEALGLIWYKLRGWI